MRALRNEIIAWIREFIQDVSVEIPNHEEHKEHEVKTTGLHTKYSFVPFVVFVVKNKQNQAHNP